MAYELYMGNILCPVTPSKIELKIKNQNKTMNLINGEEINILKEAGLTEISYDLLLPNVEYPKSMAVYKSGFVGAEYYLNEFEKMKKEKKPFFFKLIRKLPSGKALFDTEDMPVSLESYTIKDDVKQGFDIVVSIKLKQFRQYGTKIVQVLSSDEIVSIKPFRETSNAPTPSGVTVTTHTVAEGDSLWNISKEYYGTGSNHTAIQNANQSKIENPTSLPVGETLTIPEVKAPTGSDSPDTPTDARGKVSPVYVRINFGGSNMLGNKGYVKFSCKYKGLSHEYKVHRTAKCPIDRGSDIKIELVEFKDDAGYLYYCHYATIKGYNDSLTHPINGSITRTKIYKDQVVETFWRYKK